MEVILDHGYSMGEAADPMTVYAAHAEVLNDVAGEGVRPVAANQLVEQLEDAEVARIVRQGSDVVGLIAYDVIRERHWQFSIG